MLVRGRGRGGVRRTWEWLGLNLGKHAGAVACVGLAVTIILGFGLTWVRFSTSSSDYLNGNDPISIGNTHYTSLLRRRPDRRPLHDETRARRSMTS